MHLNPTRLNGRLPRISWDCFFLYTLLLNFIWCITGPSLVHSDCASAPGTPGTLGEPVFWSNRCWAPMLELLLLVWESFCCLLFFVGVLLILYLFYLIQDILYLHTMSSVMGHYLTYSCGWRGLFVWKDSMEKEVKAGLVTAYSCSFWIWEGQIS